MNFADRNGKVDGKLVAQLQMNNSCTLNNKYDKCRYVCEYKCKWEEEDQCVGAHSDDVSSPPVALVLDDDGVDDIASQRCFQQSFRRASSCILPAKFLLCAKEKREFFNTCRRAKLLLNFFVFNNVSTKLIMLMMTMIKLIHLNSLIVLMGRQSPSNVVL